MQMPKASDADKQRFRELIEPMHSEVYAVDVKPMFGQLAAFVNGNMFAGLYGDAIGVKLNETDAQELAAIGGGPFGPPERPMGGYVTIPASADAEHWIARSLGFIASLPPKASRGSSTRAASRREPASENPGRG